MARRARAGGSAGLMTLRLIDAEGRLSQPVYYWRRRAAEWQEVDGVEVMAICLAHTAAWLADGWVGVRLVDEFEAGRTRWMSGLPVDNFRAVLDGTAMRD